MGPQLLRVERRVGGGRLADCVRQSGFGHCPIRRAIDVPYLAVRRHPPSGTRGSCVGPDGGMSMHPGSNRPCGRICPRPSHPSTGSRAPTRVAG